MAGFASMIGSIFHKPEMPKLPGVPRMPDPESPAARQAALKRIRERSSQGGRSSTIYTSPYSGQALGGTS